MPLQLVHQLFFGGILRLVTGASAAVCCRGSRLQDGWLPSGRTGWRAAASLQSSSPASSSGTCFFGQVAGRNQLADDDVFLEPDQPIHLAVDRGFGEDLVVSWKEAAASQLSVLSEARVMPSRTVWAVAGSPPSASTLALISS